jgi:ribose transport system substrate-binding protein
VLLIISQFPEGENADLYVSYVGANSGQLGELAGVAMGNALKAAGKTKAKVAILAGSMAEGIAPVRVAAFKKAIANYPGVEIAQVEDVMWQPPIAERAAGQLLARFAGQGGLDAFYGMNDVLANAAVQAANSAGVKVGTGATDLIIVGGNCQAPGIKNIESGKMAATILMSPAEEANLAVGKAVDFFDGKDIGKATYTHHEIITKENVAKFAEICSY